MSREESTSRNRGNKEKQFDDLAVKRGYPREVAIDSTLDSLARQSALSIGAALNSPVHQAMLHLTRKVWEYAKANLESED